MRISACAIMSVILLLYNHHEICEPLGTSFFSCYFVTFDEVQVFHVLVANTILFAWHINEKFLRGNPDYSRYGIKSVLVVVIDPNEGTHS